MRNQRKNLIHYSERAVITPQNALAFAAFDLWISNRLAGLEFEHTSLALELRKHQQKRAHLRVKTNT